MSKSPALNRPMDRQPRGFPSEPVTLERIERALDLLAEFIVKKGRDGYKWVPVYKKLDTELTRLKALKDDMHAIRERAQRSKDRRERVKPPSTT
ncbi:hypothetical protein [Rhizobium bangladeshense]|uniref:hypothetical protein n=1 Tax=Rhizobium bangladeshense TaxID=1138189 RepID=UPI001C83A4DC|nr:hypothetical protein [Rhizobium bangladeshense]MBX4899483.1 hypothetical protein [Rhizobium bangladeshense]MBY3617696.1 hypothetical protein [Rhizobium bangladeshense]